ncbi:MAG TPA: cupin domain-containing protein [Anaerolineales bacterium]|nr:cupin domain-containing protein [Anaerolineales bacterium]
MKESAIRIQPWSGSEPPTEAAIQRLLDAEGLRSYAWSNSPGDVYGAHDHVYHKVIYVVEGSITFGLPAEGRRVTLNPGDRLELPARTVHDAVVGPRGVVCLEAHR